MRPIHGFLVALCLSPALAVAAACGSSSNGNNNAPVVTDSGVESGDDASPTPDGSGSDVTTVHEGGGDSGDGGVLGANCPPFDAGNPFVEAPHGPLPTMAYYGGPVMTNPLIVSFTFQDTPNVGPIDSFGATITSTPWFAQVTKDYCIPDGGACITGGTPGISVALPMKADAMYTDNFGMPSDAGGGGTDLNAFMNQQIAAAVAANQIPAPGANTLYAFYFPPTTTIEAGGPSCQGWGAYHSAQAYSDGTTPIVYAIMPDCPTGDPTTDLQGVTISASHEIVESVTDPNSNGVAAWYLDLANSPDAGITQAEYRNDPWNAMQFGEVGDNCESIPLSNWTLDGGTIVQRIWSTSAATLGHNPCIPVPTGEAYYNASTDKVLYVASVGSTFTVDVSAFTDMARSSWRLDAVDGTPTYLTDADGGGPLPYLQVEWVGGVSGPDGVSSLLCVNNGTTGQLKVTLLADPAADMSLQQSQEWPEADGVLYSMDVTGPGKSFPQPDGGTYVQYPYQFWPFAVITPATAAQIGVTSSGIVDMAKLRALRAKHHAQKTRGHFEKRP